MTQKKERRRGAVISFTAAECFASNIWGGRHCARCVSQPSVPRAAASVRKARRTVRRACSANKGCLSHSANCIMKPRCAPLPLPGSFGNACGRQRPRSAQTLRQRPPQGTAPKNKPRAAGLGKRRRRNKIKESQRNKRREACFFLCFLGSRGTFDRFSAQNNLCLPIVVVPPSDTSAPSLHLRV